MAKILLAEDEVLIATDWKQILEKAGHTVKLAHTGLQTLGYLQQEKFDLLITDMNMPDGGGYVVTMEASSLNDEMPIIVITGDPALLEVGALSRMPSFGADEIATKPITPENLVKLVEKSLESGPRKNLIQRLTELVEAVSGNAESNRKADKS